MLLNACRQTSSYWGNSSGPGAISCLCDPFFIFIIIFAMVNHVVQGRVQGFFLGGGRGVLYSGGGKLVSGGLRGPGWRFLGLGLVWGVVV